MYLQVALAIARFDDEAVIMTELLSQLLHESNEEIPFLIYIEHIQR